jgi:hypothetical protein
MEAICSSEIPLQPRELHSREKLNYNMTISVSEVFLEVKMLDTCVTLALIVSRRVRTFEPLNKWRRGGQYSFPIFHIATREACLSTQLHLLFCLA